MLEHNLNSCKRSEMSCQYVVEDTAELLHYVDKCPLRTRITAAIFKHRAHPMCPCSQAGGCGVSHLI
jgi:hypothetical protein